MLFTVTFNKGNKKCAMLKPCRVYSASYRRADNLSMGWDFMCIFCIYIIIPMWISIKH